MQQWTNQETEAEMEVPMYKYRCGGNKYEVVERSGRFVVWVWGWVGRNKVGDARDLVEAMALIKSHAGSSDLKTA
jgi:hypothetical protein